MKSTPALRSIRLVMIACAVAAACGRSDLNDLLDEGAAGGDDGTAANGSSRGGGIANGGAGPASGGTTTGRGGASGGSESRGGDGAGGVGAVGGAGARGGAQGTGGAAGSSGAPAAGSGGQASGIIRCGALGCEPGVSICCRGRGEFRCGATLEECPRFGLACTGASTCDPGSVCCFRRGRATCEATCERGEPGQGRGFHLCDSSAECDPDQTCILGPRGLTWCADNFP